jgi:hypothetical protein
MTELARRLIDKYGTDVVVLEPQAGPFDPSTGERLTHDAPHKAKAHITHWGTDELIPGVINMDDLKIYLASEDYFPAIGWKIKDPYAMGHTFRVVAVRSVVVQGNVVYSVLQARGEG